MYYYKVDSFFEIYCCICLNPSFVADLCVYVCVHMRENFFECQIQ